MKKYILFALLMLGSVTVYCQKELVKSIIIGTDTLNCLSQNQTNSLLEEFVLCDSYKDSLQAIVFKLQAADSIKHIDSLLIDNYKKELNLSNQEIIQLKIQISSISKIDEICEKERKRAKRKQWLVGIVTSVTGAAAGILVGVFIK